MMWLLLVALLLSMGADCAEPAAPEQTAFNLDVSGLPGYGPVHNGVVSCQDCHNFPTPGGRMHPNAGFDGANHWTEDGLIHQATGVSVEPLGDGPVSRRRVPVIYLSSRINRISSAGLPEDPDDEDGDGISGRKLPVDTRDARYGWQGLRGFEHYFVAEAVEAEFGLTRLDLLEGCELGLLEPFAGPPCPQQGIQVASAIWVDWLRNVMEDPQDMRPRYLREPTAGVQAELDAGEVLFSDFQCAACHTPVLGGERIYQDLLHHDMGPALDDGVSAGVAGTSALQRAETFEWRTPSLCFLVPGMPMLHDGRAPNLHMAIWWHGGEAEASRESYNQASGEERRLLRQFVTSLGNCDGG